MPIIKNPLSGSVNFTSLDNALNELDNVINGAYESSASVLPFTFTGNTVTGYTGSDTNMVIPTSYSLGEPEEVTVDGVLFTSEELTDLRYQLYQFDTIEFKDIESDYTKTYAETELETLPMDFPNGAYLTMVRFLMFMEALDLGQIFERFDKFPVVCNGMQLQNYTSYEDYVSSLPGIVSLTFNGTATIQTYITGNDYMVTSIGNNAFQDCDGLSSITIPDSVTSIGNTAFRDCSSLTSITIPNSVASIGDEAFWGCSGLTSITIPSGVTSIGAYAFSGCSSLVSVTFDNNSQLTSIGSSVFSSCSSLTSIVIPNNVTIIRDFAFSGCSGLASVSIPEGVTSIGESAFNGCSRLASITIPEGVTSIGNTAFRGCTSLTSITIPDSVTSIGYMAFYECSGLTSITIPDGVTSIGNNAFNDCSGLTSITVLRTTPATIEYGVFDSTNNAPIYVPSQSVSAYKSATNWSSYASRIQAISN